MSETGNYAIFKTQQQISNMRIEEIVVPEATVQVMLSQKKLTAAGQKQAIYDLVDRTPGWLNLEQEEQEVRILAALTQETIIYLLRESGEITDKCDFYESEIDEEGSVKVRAFYTEVNRQMRRALKKQTAEERARQARMDQAVNILSQNQHIMDLAKQRMVEQGLLKGKEE